MKLFYKAVTNEGKSLNGFLDAKNANEAAAYLRSKDLFPIKIVENKKNNLLNSIPFLKEKIKFSDIINFTKQMASMLSSGITFSRSLEILRGQTQKSVLVDMLDSIIADVREGTSFSHAISKYPEAFSPIYIAFVEASEGSGLLDKTLARLAETMEKQQKLKNSIRGALMYPVIVVSMMFIVACAMMIFVIPQLSTLYESMNISLPFITQVLIWTSDFFISFWYIAIGLSALIIFLFRRWHTTIEGQLTVDSILLKLPIMGSLIKDSILAEFSRTSGALLTSGTLVVEALRRVADITGNIHYKNAIIDVSKKVEKGVSVGDAMNSYDLFPPELIELVKTGEQTGKLDDTLIKASEYFENNVDQGTKNLSTAMEPIILVILGIGVALLVLSIITPIYQITNSF